LPIAHPITFREGVSRIPALIVPPFCCGNKGDISYPLFVGCRSFKITFQLIGRNRQAVIAIGCSGFTPLSRGALISLSRINRTIRFLPQWLPCAFSSA
jgi:hypothetical protein